ncbi:MAG TPA: AI-2E family transporter, partial [Ottowia sp.]|nr:AI-2E family transporter [Ottowia sp.]
MNTPALQRAVFLLLLAGVTLAFFRIIAPFFGAVFWAVVLTLLFMPLFRRLRAALRGRATLAALATMLICLLIVVVPLAFIVGA